ncbi:hypothetical protein, partial [Chryseobacterium sp. SIMBA_028]
IYVYSNGKISTIPLFIKDDNPSRMYYAFTLDLASNLMYFVDENAKKNIEAYNIITHKRTVCNISLEKNTPAYSKGNFYIFRHNNKVEVYKLY